MTESIFTIEADQWSEHGYIYRDGIVYGYETDRKEASHMEFSPKTAEAFLAQTDLPDEIREWVRECSGLQGP